MTGSGDIAPEVPGAAGGRPAATIEDHLIGAFAGLIVVVVVGAMFMTAEYRRGLIRITLAASPRRGRMLAAKAIVIGSVTFAAGPGRRRRRGPVGDRLARGQGVYVFPVTSLTELRVVAGTAALLAVAAVLALAVGTMLRRSAAAVTAAIVAIVLPYLLGARCRAARQRRRAGCSGSPRPPPSPIQQTFRPTPRSPPSTRRSGLLPASAVGRVRRAGLLRGARAGPGRLPAPPEGRMSGALHAEWTKLRTLPGTVWLLAAAIVLTVAVSTAATAADQMPGRPAAPWTPPSSASPAIDLGQALVAILAVLAISGEYSTGMIRTTLTAMPRRATVLAAKAAIITGPVLAAGTVAVLGSLLAGRLILPGHGFTAARGYPPCPWPTGRCCAPPPGRCSTWP